ncbi:MAG: GNAT family N-acetyltransferase [Candidatus Delongbacteria bacterium]|nr:GNAT family N-acetyltransferase [Candidatus Delongbacteria bacterium]
MAFFVEYEPENKRDHNEFYNRFDLYLRQAVFEDYIEAAKITTAREGEKADHDKNLQNFKKHFGKKSGENEYFVACIKDKTDPGTAEKVIGYSHIEYCDFTTEEYKPYADHNTPSGWYLLGLGVYSEYRRLGIGTKLTEIRLKWAKDHSDAKKVYFYTNPKNVTSQEFHMEMGFNRIDGEWTFKDRPAFKTILFEIDI